MQLYGVLSMPAPQCKGNSMAGPCLSLKNTIWQELLPATKISWPCCNEQTLERLAKEKPPVHHRGVVAGFPIWTQMLPGNQPSPQRVGICTQLQLTLKLHVLGGKKSSLLTQGDTVTTASKYDTWHLPHIRDCA